MYTFARIVTGIARIIIWLVKFALKILLIPVITGFLSYGFGLDPLSEMWRTVGYGVAFCMLPLAGGWMIERITLLNLQISLWLHR